MAECATAVPPVGADRPGAAAPLVVVQQRRRGDRDRDHQAQQQDVGHPGDGQPERRARREHQGEGHREHRDHHHDRGRRHGQPDQHQHAEAAPPGTTDQLDRPPQRIPRTEALGDDRGRRQGQQDRDPGLCGVDHDDEEQPGRRGHPARTPQRQRDEGTDRDRDEPDHQLRQLDAVEGGQPGAAPCPGRGDPGPRAVHRRRHRREDRGEHERRHGGRDEPEGQAGQRRLQERPDQVERVRRLQCTDRLQQPQRPEHDDGVEQAGQDRPRGPAQEPPHPAHDLPRVQRSQRHDPRLRRHGLPRAGMILGHDSPLSSTPRVVPDTGHVGGGSGRS